MSIRYSLITLALLSSLSGCRYFKSEASLQIRALNGEGKPLVAAKVMVNKVQVGTTDAQGMFKGNLELPVEEPLLVEVSKPATDTFFAPYFETIKVKRGDVNTFKLTATLYGIAKEAAISPEAPAAAPVSEAAEVAASVPDSTQVLAVGGEAPTTTLAAPAEAAAITPVDSENARPLTFYVVSGRDSVENASIYFGDASKKQWLHGCYSNSKGRCSFSIPEHMDTAVILVRAKGFQTQSRSFQLLDGDKVRFELNRGRSLEIFAITPNQGNMEGVADIRVSLNGRSIGKTDIFGSLIEPLVAEADFNGKVTLEADQWLPSHSEFTLNAQSNESVIQHFQSVKPKAPRIAVMDFVVYRDKQETPLPSLPTTENLESALGQAGAEVVNSPALNGRLSAHKISLNDLSAANWGQIKKLGEPVDYILRPSLVEGAKSRIVLSAIDMQGRLIFSTSQSIKAKGSSQATLKDLAVRVLQNLQHEGAVTEAVGDEFRINIGKNQGLRAGDKIQITGNLRMPSGEISAWDTVGSGVVTEVAPDRSRIRMTQTQPNSKVEPGNSAALDQPSSASTDSVSVQIGEEATKGPVAQAEVYADDRWLGASDNSGQAVIPQSDLLGLKEILVLSPGYAPKTLTLNTSKNLTASLVHDGTPVQIESQPTGALVKINGRDLGRTPIDTDIPYPGQVVNIEIGGVDGFEYITRSQGVSNRGIVLRGSTAVTLNRDPIQASKVLITEGKLTEACQLLEDIPTTDPNFPQAQHQLGEIYLNQNHDPVKAASAFHKVTSHPSVENYKDHRFIGTYINEAVALYQAGEQAVASDSNLAISYWRQAEFILSKTEEQLRYVPQAQYNQAVHTLSYYRALSLHKTWAVTLNADDQERAMKHWKDYIQGTALALPQDLHFDWVKKAEGYFQQLQTARNKKSNSPQSPVAM